MVSSNDGATSVEPAPMELLDALDDFDDFAEDTTEAEDADADEMDSEEEELDTGDRPAMTLLLLTEDEDEDEDGLADVEDVEIMEGVYREVEVFTKEDRLPSITSVVETATGTGILVVLIS